MAYCRDASSIIRRAAFGQGSGDLKSQGKRARSIGISMSSAASTAVDKYS
jgi:hypothetical protein